MITATDWTESFLSQYMQGQEKLTFYVILLFFTITLCFTLISANEKLPSTNEPTDEPTPFADMQPWDYLFPIKFVRYVCVSVSTSVKTIVTMPFVLRRLTLAECCCWYGDEHRLCRCECPCA